MRSLTNKIESHLGKIGGNIADYPWIYIILSLLFVAAIASNLPKLTIDTSTEGFLHEDSEERIQYDAFRNEFGREERLIIAVKAPDLFDLQTLNTLRRLHRDIENEVPYIKEVTSLINARNTYGTENELIVDDLLAEWPGSKQQIETIKQTALNNPLYPNLLLSEDGTVTVIAIESQVYSSQGELDQTMASADEILEDELSGFDEAISDVEATRDQPFITEEENTEMVLKVAEIVERYQHKDFQLYVAGSPSVVAYLKDSMMNDMKKFIVLIIVTIMIFLALLFRRISGVIFPLMTVILAVLSTVGMMAASGTPLKVVTQILPSFLLAVGVGASVHVLAIFYKHFDQYGNRKEAIAHTLQHSGLAIIMTSATTAAGMLSFSTSGIAPVADLGIFAAIGVMIALVFTLVLLPALLMIIRLKPKVIARSDGHHDHMDHILTAIGHFSQNHARAIVIFSVAFMAITIPLSSLIGYAHNPLKWLPEDHSARMATELIDQKMRGSITLEILIDTQRNNGVYDLGLLKKIDTITQQMTEISGDGYFIGKALSLVDVLKEIHRALNENRTDYYRLTERQEVIPQEILLFENSGSDDLKTFVDSRFSKARITLKAPWVDAFVYLDMLEDVADVLQNNLDDSIQITTTGLLPMMVKTATVSVTSAGNSYLIAIVVITLMMILLLSSIKLGLLSMVANLFPIFFILAVMVLFKLPLDLFTILIGAIIIGIAIDDIVHFMHNFRRYHLDGMTTRDAVVATLTTTGRAMTITTIVLCFGFILYMFASMKNLFVFGLLTSIAFVVALASVMLLAPALMALVYPDPKKQ